MPIQFGPTRYCGELCPNSSSYPHPLARAQACCSCKISQPQLNSPAHLQSVMVASGGSSLPLMQTSTHPAHSSSPPV